MSRRPALHTHICPGDCGERIPPARVTCPDCWMRLPAPLRNRVVVAARAEPESSEHQAAVYAAITWYQLNPREQAPVDV